MQGKGFIKIVAFLLLLLSIYQLLFTWKANQVEKTAVSKATSYVANLKLDEEAKYEEQKAFKQRYLDSLSDEPVFLKGLTKAFTYKKVKESALNLGLDLQGGMSVVLEADVRNLIENISNNKRNENLVAALDAAKAEQAKSNADFVDLFLKNFKGDNQELVALFQNADNDEILGAGASKENVRSYLKKEANDAFDSTYDIIQSRVDKFGLNQPNIQRQDDAKRILVEIPGVDNPERVRNLLQSSANLEFYEMFTNVDLPANWDAANLAVKNELNKIDPAREARLTKAIEAGTTKADAGDDKDLEGLLKEAGDKLDTKSEEAQKAELSRDFPLFELLQVSPNPGYIVGYAQKKDVEKINQYLDLPAVKAAFPNNAKLAFDAKPFVNEGEDGSKAKIFALYALKTQPDGSPQLDGSVVTNAFPSADQFNNPVVSMQMNQKGANLWYELTGKNVGKPLAVVLDDKVYSYPNINEAIGGGSSQISGNFTNQEAEDLSTVLKTGKLEVPAQIIEEEVVGPTIGGASAQAGLISLLAGLALVLVFMVIYYGKAGIIADVALLFNLLLVIGVLAAFGATLTLPGIAGLVLTIGMAVDANVIIFERIREELGKGFELDEAVKNGYQHSYSAIIDANVTTLIIAIILTVFGIGPVKGFGTVLAIGIFTSFFTGVLFTRVIKDDMLKKAKDITYWTSMSKNWFQNLNFNFIGKRKIAYIISGVIVLASLVNVVARGGKAFDLGVDLSAGRSYTIRFDEPKNANDVKAKLDVALDGSSNMVRTFGKAEQLKITTNYLTQVSGTENDSIAEAKIFEILKDDLGANVTLDQFKSDYLLSAQKVDSSIADDLRRSALWLTAISLLAIFIYLLVRFRKWQFGIAAVATLAHDTLVILAVFSFLRHISPFALEVDQAFIAALLTVIGYSINDTVIVFDRIREELTLDPKTDYKQVINGALNSTLSRTVITSLTTLFVVLLLFIFGGDVIRGFAFALLIGVIVGTYSSLFVATPIVVDLFSKSVPSFEKKAYVDPLEQMMEENSEGFEWSEEDFNENA